MQSTGNRTAAVLMRKPVIWGWLTSVVAAAALGCVCMPASAMAETPQPFWTACATNSEEDLQCNAPRGVAVIPATAGGGFAGNVIVADSGRQRVVEFTVWGQWVRVWGWDVVQAGPDNTGTGFEICVRANGDICKSGSSGTGAGQFGDIVSPQGVAVDSAGNVYVTDRGLPSNQRVQKFDPEGHFLRMWGKEVNEGTGSNKEICASAGAPTDVCKAGGVGTGPSQFGLLSVVGDYIDVDTAGTASVADDKVYVGEVGRIQRFNVEGEYQGEIAVSGETVKGLTTGPGGSLYAAFCGASCGNGSAAKAGVRKLSSAGAVLGTVAVADPQGVAADSQGNLYALDGAGNPTIRKFSPTGEPIFEEESIFPYFPTYPFAPGIATSTGIETGDGCHTAPKYDLYVAKAAEAPNGLIRSYGPPPDEAHVETLESCEPPEVPPSIEEQGAVVVGLEQAAVQAKINPHYWGDTATYYVQYGTAACIEGGSDAWEAGCVSRRPVSDTSLNAGFTNVGVKTTNVLLSGLVPGTRYLYRFVSQSSGGGPVFGVGGKEGEGGEVASFTTTSQPPPPETNCPNQGFRIGASALLPDCRAYEMVSPVDKNGGDIRPNRRNAYIQTAPDGNRITYSAIPAFSNQPSNKVYNQYLGERTGGGWANRGINAPLGRQLTAPIYPTPEVLAFSPDLCNEWLRDFNYVPLTPDAKPGFANLYRQGLCGKGEFEALTISPLPEDEYIGTRALQGFSADLGQVFFGATAGLTPDAMAGKTNPQIYEYEPASRGLHLVSVLPDGSADPGISTRGAEVGSGSGDLGGSLEHAVSEDGSRVYWTSRISGGVGRLYLRENPNQPQSTLGPSNECTEPAMACTVPVSSAEEATFWTATPNGAEALYSEGNLATGEATLYRFDAASQESDPVADGIAGLLGTSTDLGRIYYVSTKALTGKGVGEANSEGAFAIEGKSNLYLDEEGRITFIATLAGGEGGNVPLRSFAVGAKSAYFRASRVTPDGARIAFQSRAPLTSFDNTDAASGEQDVEVLTYEAGGALHCVSCHPSGVRPRGREMAEAFEYPQLSPSTGAWAAAWIPGWEHQLHASNVLSANGKLLFFNSLTPLVARDTNGAQDVYEWEAPGEGRCKESSPHFHALNGGCVFLISSGKSPFESEFWDASTDGRNVFFTTESSLLPQDPGNIDLYDARVEGGFPQSTIDRGCEGEACQSPPGPPEDPTPSSGAVKGQGNVEEKPAKCRRPKVRRKGRCMPRRPHKRSRAKHGRRAAG